MSPLCPLLGLPSFDRPRRDVRPAAQSLFLLAQEKEPKEGHPGCARSALNGPTTLRSLRPEGEQRTRPQPAASELRQLCSTASRQPSGRDAAQAAQTGPRLQSDRRAGLGAGCIAAYQPVRSP